MGLVAVRVKVGIRGGVRVGCGNSMVGVRLRRGLVLGLILGLWLGLRLRLGIGIGVRFTFAPIGVTAELHTHQGHFLACLEDKGKKGKRSEVERGKRARGQGVM